MNGFQEVTADFNGYDVMIDIDIKTGQVIGLYTYNDSSIEIYSEKLDDYVEKIGTWKTNLNPLFVHCPKRSIPSMLKQMQDDLMFCSADLDECSEVINKMVNRYKLDIATNHWRRKLSYSSLDRIS